MPQALLQAVHTLAAKILHLVLTKQLAAGWSKPSWTRLLRPAPFAFAGARFSANILSQKPAMLRYG